MHSQVVVLGGGPGGYAAAFMAADLGMQVTIVEADPRLGGTCMLRGCIPSKALLHVAKVISEAREMAEWGVTFGEPQLNIDVLRARKEKVLDTLAEGLAGLAKRRIGVILGSVVQGLLIAAGFLIPMMFAIGIIFDIIWVVALRLGQRIDVERAERAEGAPREPVTLPSAEV